MCDGQRLFCRSDWWIYEFCALPENPKVSSHLFVPLCALGLCCRTDPKRNSKPYSDYLYLVLNAKVWQIHRKNDHEKGKYYLTALYCWIDRVEIYVRGNDTHWNTVKQAKTTKKIVLRLECVEPNCRSKRMLAIKRCKHFELGGDKKRKVRLTYVPGIVKNYSLQHILYINFISVVLFIVGLISATVWCQNHPTEICHQNILTSYICR